MSFLLSQTRLIGDFFDKRQHAVNCSVRFPVLISFVYRDLNDRRIARMIGPLERPESRKDRRARRTWKPELSEKPELPDWSLRQYIGRLTVHFLNKQRRPNYWDLAAEFIVVGLSSPVHKRIRCANTLAQLWLRGSPLPCVAYCKVFTSVTY